MDSAKTNSSGCRYRQPACLLLAVTVVVTLAGCGKSESTSASSSEEASAVLEMKVFDYGMPMGPPKVVVGSTLTNISSRTVRIGEMSAYLPDRNRDGRPDGAWEVSAGGQALKSGDSAPLTFQIPTSWLSWDATTIEGTRKEQRAAIRQVKLDIKDEDGKPLVVRVVWPDKTGASGESVSETVLPSGPNCNEVLGPAGSHTVTKEDVIDCMGTHLAEAAAEYFPRHARQVRVELDPGEQFHLLSEQANMGHIIDPVSKARLEDVALQRFKREHDWSDADIAEVGQQIRERVRKAVEEAPSEGLSQYQQHNLAKLKEIALASLEDGANEQP